MIVHFDYNIGDTVKLTKDVGYENRWWDSQKFEEIKDISQDVEPLFFICI